jgi:twinkle protein
MAPDDYGAQKKFINELVSIGKANDTHMHLVAHMRKPPKDTRYVPDRYDISGGSDISNQADNILICWADMEKIHESHKPDDMQNTDIMSRVDQLLVVEKQRNGDFEGKFGLWFDPRSLQQKETEHARIKDYTPRQA